MTPAAWLRSACTSSGGHLLGHTLLCMVPMCCLLLPRGTHRIYIRTAPGGARRWAGPARSPACARNSLILVKYVPPKSASVLEPDYPDDMVHYGQKVRLALYPEAIGASVDCAGGARPLCLFSKPASTTHCAKYSRNQLVGFTHQGSFDSVWQVRRRDAGRPRAGVCVVVVVVVVGGGATQCVAGLDVGRRVGG